jgi:hypothetical protein
VARSTGSGSSRTAVRATAVAASSEWPSAPAEQRQQVQVLAAVSVISNCLAATAGMPW